MGGTGSAHYARFQSLCYTAFIGLRKNANLILNLVALMVEAGIQDIQMEPDKAVWKVGLPCCGIADCHRSKKSSCLICPRRRLSDNLKRC